MKLNKNYIQTSIFILLYLFAIYYWTQPLQERALPYGEYDAMSHFEVGDYMSQNDRSLMALPPYIDMRYGFDNDFKNHVLWYPPTFHSSLGVAQVFGGERVVPVFLLNTIMSTFIVISLYFVIRKLFGFLPAILSSLLIIFSPRDYMPFLWGQWPERFAYAFIPIILYCFYEYFISYSKDNKKPIYLYLTALFLGINLLVHPLVFFHSLLGLATLYIFLAIKNKKFVFNAKHIAISAIIFLLLFLAFPYQTFNIFPNLGIGDGGGTSETESVSLTRLFHWSLEPEKYAGSVPASYFSFNQMHGKWTLYFLIIGLLFLIVRRRNRDIFLLAWIVSLYLVLHRDLIGMSSFLHRSLSASAHIFAPITAIGLLSLGSLLKLKGNLNNYLKYGLAIVFLYFTLTVNMAGAEGLLNKESFNPYSHPNDPNSGFFTTLNDAELEADDWIMRNVPEEFNISVMGVPHTPDGLLGLTSKKIKWMAAVSQRVNRFHFLRTDQDNLLKSKEWYLMLDYSMLIPLRGQEPFESIFIEMERIENEILTNHTLKYNKGNIKVYHLEN